MKLDQESNWCMCHIPGTRIMSATRGGTVPFKSSTFSFQFQRICQDVSLRTCCHFSLDDKARGGPQCIALFQGLGTRQTSQMVQKTRRPYANPTSVQVRGPNQIPSLASPFSRFAPCRNAAKTPSDLHPTRSATDAGQPGPNPNSQDPNPRATYNPRREQQHAR